MFQKQNVMMHGEREQKAVFVSNLKDEAVDMSKNFE
jgi:hypothetical protein